MRLYQLRTLCCCNKKKKKKLELYAIQLSGQFGEDSTAIGNIKCASHVLKEIRHFIKKVCKN